MESDEQADQVIVRISEAVIRPGQSAAFLARLRELVDDFPERYEGLISHEILQDAQDSCRVSYLSRWRGESSLVNYAGENWANDPVTFPGEERYLSAPLTLRHFRSEKPFAINSKS